MKPSRAKAWHWRFVGARFFCAKRDWVIGIQGRTLVNLGLKPATVTFVLCVLFLPTLGVKLAWSREANLEGC